MRHRLLSRLILVLALGAVAAPLVHATGPYDGYKSSYPQLHAILSTHVTPMPGRGFDWRDASVGAGVAAGVIVILAVGALLFMRRRTALAMTTIQPRRRRRFSIKAIFGLLLAVGATAVFTVASSAESPGSARRSGVLQVTKECSKYTAVAGSYCTIT